MFSLPTLLLIGATCQSLLFAVLPFGFAFLPVLILLLYTALTTLYQLLFMGRNNYLSQVIHGRVSAQLPHYVDSFGRQPAGQPLAVFHMGVRFNHPLGMLAPGGAEIGKHFMACVSEITDHSDEFGLLGHSYWRADERANQNTLLVIFYFTSIEKLNSFAHSKLHKKAWEWYINFCKRSGGHIGVYHETFYAAPGGYETIYANMPPVLLGETQVKMKHWTGHDEFIRPLVDAEVDPLRSQMSRMGLDCDAVSMVK